MQSILVDDTEHCIFSGSSNVEEHHVFFGSANRAMAEKYHLTVPLSQEYHRSGPNSPHKNRVVDLALKCWAQSIYELKIGDRNDFRRDFGKSYL